MSHWRVCRCVSEGPLGARSSSSGVRPFSEVPGLWKHSVSNLYNFWKQDGFKNLHRIMVQNFNTFGPIYRERIGYYDSVNVVRPEDAALVFRAEGRFPRRLNVAPWTEYRDLRNLKYGVLLKSGEDWRSNRVILNKEVIDPKVQEHFVPLLDAVGQDFVARIHTKISRSGNNKWTTELSHELFKYALESVGSVLYGQRLGLLSDDVDPEAQNFIDCITTMFKTTAPMLYVPPRLLRRLGHRVWTDHVHAWDGIFNQADRCIQNIYRRQDAAPQAYPGGSPQMYPGGSPQAYPGGSPQAYPGGSPQMCPGGSPQMCPGGSPQAYPGGSPQAYPGGSPQAYPGGSPQTYPGGSPQTCPGGAPQTYPGVLARLLLLDKLSMEDVKASVTELMAGGVDTTSITLLWTLYELSRQPRLQEELRAEVVKARAESQGNMLLMLKHIPLVKGALKETLRLHPVAVSLQRYITEDIIIQKYHIPAGTLVQLGLFAMGRDPRVFPGPEQFLPTRWLRTENQYFRSLGFGFGPRQCLGRRVAETEMQVFIIHMLENFKVEKPRHLEARSTFELILVPDKPLVFTLSPL